MLTLYVRLDVAPMTKKVDKLTKSPKMAETAIATIEAAVYSYLQKLCLFDSKTKAFPNQQPCKIMPQPHKKYCSMQDTLCAIFYSDVDSAIIHSKCPSPCRPKVDLHCLPRTLSI